VAVQIFRYLTSVTALSGETEQVQHEIKKKEI